MSGGLDGMAVERATKIVEEMVTLLRMVDIVVVLVQVVQASDFEDSFSEETEGVETSLLEVFEIEADGVVTTVDSTES